MAAAKPAMLRRLPLKQRSTFLLSVGVKSKRKAGRPSMTMGILKETLLAPQLATPQGKSSTPEHTHMVSAAELISLAVPDSGRGMMIGGSPKVIVKTLSKRVL